ncbi:MATE family efflux transporter [Aminipila terrae]|uniref:MATE family efflux transporter n=1 Tax=Aminipila terrae TaxID=2697030 RepID=A0A6P1MHG1_9FIRM|nr:MATE family efflux transporter [Aminipila terrae]QHI73327.1 MATE family efflux transporter [Aminipila terrae]
MENLLNADKAQNLNHKKSFYKKMWLVAVPVVIQNVISIGLNLVDILMIGRLGEKELAAVGSATQIFFIFSMICFGLYSGAAVYVAQYWGIRNTTNIKKVIGIDLTVGVSLATATFIIALLFAPQLIWIFSRDREVIALGAKFLRTVCFSYILTSITFAMVYNSRAVQRLKAATIINGTAILINTLLNYCLIYGKWGMPAMGVRGSALATVIARIVELTSIMVYIYINKEHPFHGPIKEFLSFDKTMFKQVMKTAVPVIFTEGGWAAVTSLTFVAYGMLGATALAVIQIAEVVADLSQAVYFGLGNATAVIIGESLGQKNTEAAFNYGGMAMKITWGLNIIVTLFLIAISRPIADVYHFNSETTHLLILVLTAWAFTITPKMLAYVLICGILRAGGDTLYSLVIDLSCNVMIQLSIAFFSVLVLHLPIYFVVIFVSISDIVKTIICYRRYYSKKWMNIVT